MTEAELRDQLKQAMRDRDAVARDVLRAVLSGLKNRSIEAKGAELAEADIVAVIRKEAKQRRETLEFVVKAGGRDAEKADLEAAISVLDGLLPTSLSDEELRAAIESILGELDAPAMGPVMQALGARHAGRYDGKRASTLVRELLAARSDA